MNIFKSSLSGDLTRMRVLLDANPENLNASLELRDDDLSIKVTPLFLAAIAGQVDAVKELLDRGASAKLDLFTWTCLCPNKEARENVLDLIFDDEYRSKIDPDLPLVYQKISKGCFSNAKDGIEKAIDSEYYISPYNVAILSGTEGCLYNEENKKPSIYSSTFREMSSLELTTYRVAVHKLLKNKVHPVNEDFSLEEIA